MSKFYKILIIFFFSTISVNANTQSSVAYLDLDFILSNSISGKKMFEKLKKQEDKKVAELKLKEENLKTEENKILSSKNIISREQYNLNVDEFKKKIQNYKIQKSDEIDKLKKIRNDEVLNFLKIINPLIEQYMKDNSINIIFDKKNIIKNMMYKNCFIHSSAMFKKNYYKRVGGYNPFFYYAQDYDLWSRLSSVGEVGNLEKRLTFFRDHPSSISRSKTEKQMKYSIIVSCNNYFYSKYKRFFKINLNLEKNHFFLKNNALIKDFYRCISFLNRKKLKVKGIENLPQLSLKSLFFCLKQPKMFIYNLL